MLITHHGKAAKRGALAAVFAVLLLATLLSADPALANPRFVAAQPPNDAVLDEAPSQIELRFDQPLDLGSGATTVMLERLEGAAEIRPGYAAVDPRNPTRLMVSPPQSLDKGDYVIKWSVTSAEDGSVSEGEYAFSISSSAPPGTGTESGPDILFLALITLAGIGGGTILGLLLYVSRRALGLGGHPTSETSLPEHH